MSKNFPFTWGGGGGPSTKNFFFPVWTCIKPNLVSKIFPFTRGGWGSPLTKKFFFQSEHVSSQIWCPKIFPLLGGGGGSGSLVKKKIFFPVWTCIKPNLVSKIFPLYWDGAPPSPSKAGWAYPKIWDLGSPPVQDWISLPENLRPGNPPPPPPPPTPSKVGSAYPKIWDLGPPPPQNVNRQTPMKTVTSRRATYAGGN